MLRRDLESLAAGLARDLVVEAEQVVAQFCELGPVFLVGAGPAQAGTFYMKTGTLDLRGNGYTLASEIVVGFVSMNGNPSGITIAYDLNRNVPLTHDESHTTTTQAMSYDAGGLVG